MSDSNEFEFGSYLSPKIPSYASEEYFIDRDEFVESNDCFYVIRQDSHGNKVPIYTRLSKHKANYICEVLNKFIGYECKLEGHELSERKREIYHLVSCACLGGRARK